MHLKITGLVGRIRMRIQLGTDPPWLSTTQVSFPEMPEVRPPSKRCGLSRQISINCRPLRTLDVMQLPFVAGYVLKSMRTVLKGFTAPQSYVLDVSVRRASPTELTSTENPPRLGHSAQCVALG